MRKLLNVCGVLALLVSVAAAQEQPRRGGGRGGMMQQGGVAILAIPEVQTELKLTDDQKKTIGELADKMREEMRGVAPNFQELGSLPQEERQKKMEEFRKKGEELSTKAVAEVSKTLDAKQMERFGQLRLQREGIMAFGRPDVADKLSLTAEQKESISKILAEARQNGGPGRGGNFQDMSDEERQAFRKKMMEAREKAKADVLAALTPDQKTNYEKMLGEKFEFPQGGFGGPGGGGRQGGGEKKRPASKKDN